ncbi:MAG: YraN family protein [Bacteroidales bacterium]|nr:YraN family protein [Bacteroidales bacterium]
MAYIKFFRTNRNDRSLESRREATDLGVVGEQMATRYLEDQGYVILERNYRYGKHEVDVIALDHGTLVIVEVKTRADDLLADPEDAVDHRKRGFIVRVANQYISSHHRTEDVRFDIISIVKHDDQPAIRHIKDAFNVMNY